MRKTERIKEAFKLKRVFIAQSKLPTLHHANAIPITSAKILQVGRVCMPDDSIVEFQDIRVYFKND
jgi:hypothetical protein